MKERKFVMRQFFMKSERLSKFHIFEVDKDGYTWIALCGSRPRRPHDSRFTSAQEIDNLLKRAPRLYKHYNNRQPCKRCLQKAEHLRNPLDRLASIETPE